MQTKLIKTDGTEYAAFVGYRQTQDITPGYETTEVIRVRVSETFTARHVKGYRGAKVNLTAIALDEHKKRGIISDDSMVAAGTEYTLASRNIICTWDEHVTAIASRKRAGQEYQAQVEARVKNAEQYKADIEARQIAVGMTKTGPKGETVALHEVSIDRYRGKHTIHYISQSSLERWLAAEEKVIELRAALAESEAEHEARV